MRREDLLALTPEGLAALANRGLVKRAAKELDAGAVPDLRTGEDGTVHAGFPDGAETALPAAGGLEAATCTCSTAAKCRHRIGAVLAYQRRHETAAPTETGATETPASITDDRLREAFGRRALTAADKTRRAGYTAHLTWPGPDRPAVAALPASTVTFLVPGRLGYVHTDATGPARGTAVILAVWAFREAEPQSRSVTVGGAAASAGDLTRAVALSEQVLLDGVEGADTVLTAALTREAEALTERRLHWPAGALNDLVDQLQRHRDRAASYDPQRLAAVLAEIPARQRSSRVPTGSPNSQILGSDEADQTPLALTRLTGLGCRVGTDGDKRTAEIYLAHSETGTVLTVRRHWPIPEDRTLTGHDLAARRVAGCRIGALASGNVVTEAARRTAARALVLGTGRLAETRALPLGQSWNDLPPSLLIGDLDALKTRLEAMPPALIRPRVDAELVRVIVVEHIREVGYDPAAQRLEAVVTAPEGGSARLRAAYRPSAPGALEAIEAALEQDPTAIAGTLRRHRGELIVEPTAILTAEGAKVPDLAPGDDTADLAAASVTGTDPVAAALETAIRACADLAHRGLRHAREPSRERAEEAAAGLRRVGLQSAASCFVQLSESLRIDDDAARTAAWTHAAIRTLTTAELY
ncbi:hypothetical protein GCM10027447_26670 [Glycomyces halotolerans]